MQSVIMLSRCTLQYGRIKHAGSEVRIKLAASHSWDWWETCWLMIVKTGSSCLLWGRCRLVHTCSLAENPGAWPRVVMYATVVESRWSRTRTLRTKKGKGGCVHEEAEEICASSLSYLYCSDNPTRSTMTVFLDSMNATRPSLFWSVTCVCVTADQGRVAFMVYAEAEEIRASSYLYCSDNPTITRSTMTVFLDSGTCIILHS